MKKIHEIILSTFLILLNIAPAYTQLTSNSKYTPDEIIIKLKNEKIDVLSSLESIPKKFKILKSKPLFHKNIKTKNLGLNRIYKLSITSKLDILKTLHALQQDPQIEYAQLNHIYYLDYLPNDPYLNQQWIVKKIRLDQAWDIERGSPDILIGIVDTGIDYHHQDLVANLWINSVEDLNGNGRVDSSDFNNLDDDNNGFIDDIRGWDFTDAPHFPDGGDYLTRDNDPLDEHGHGTSVAGIIGAVADNHLGIAGTAYGCRMVNVRAGTSQGLLEEDDVASAIVYAVDNGARIINMSFGDVVASPLLHDVIKYAFSNNCVLIASAGNSATADIHYPSGYKETISVGATTQQDLLADFSNYGTTIDLVAPGVSLFTTKRNNRYGEFSGTSASAPIVSAVAALILSHQPHLSNEDVRNILCSSTDDLGLRGWDNIFGAGQVNAFNALQIDIVSEAKINSPRLDEGFHVSPLLIYGTASGALLDNYQLFYGSGDNPADWLLIEQVSQRQVINDSLAIWDFSSLPDTTYTIRLRVNNKDDNSVEDRTRIFIDRTTPRIFNIKTTDMIDGVFPTVLIEFQTDDLCQSSIFYRPVNSTKSYQEINLKYIARNHRFNFTPEFGRYEFEFYINALNKSGLQTKTDPLKIDLTKTEISTNRFVQLDYQLPAGYMLNKIVDFDADGNKEIILNKFGSGDSFDKLFIYEFKKNEFTEVFHSEQMAIPRDWGDSDKDGLQEILVGAGQHSFIYESPAPGLYPSSIVWSDSNDFWASRFSDLDNDGKNEIIARTGNTFSIWECVGDNDYSLIASLVNPTSGENGTGVPHTEIGDFDDDGLLEILIGDYDGDIYIHEATGDNTFQITWWQRQPLIDCIDFITAGDYDGDGVAEFAVGSHSPPELDAEHEYDARHWIFRIYKNKGDNSFYPVWEQAFFGFETIKNSSNGISSGDVDNDHRDELLINVFPDFYIIDFDTIRNCYSPLWYFYPTQSQTNIIGDIDNDHQNEFFINTGKQIISFADIAVSHLPPPSGFRAYPLDTNQVRLIWNHVINAEEYFIYRGKIDTQLDKIYQTTLTELIDTAVTKDSTYWYAICAVSSADTGRKTAPISVTPGERPYVTAAEFIYPNQVRLTFSESMSPSIKDAVHYSFSNKMGTPSSIIVSKSSQEVILTLETNSLYEGCYTVTVVDVADIDRTPIDTTRNRVSFQVTNPISAPYLIRAELTAPHEITLYFNQQLDPVSTSKVEHYVIKPNIIVEHATVSSTDSSIVILTLNSSIPIGALGRNYIITVSNVRNKFNIPIKVGQGSQASLIFYKKDLSQVFTYPNPYRFQDGPGYVMFANLTKRATVKILTLTGEVIKELQETDGNGGVEWDLKNKDGKFVSAGIYLYYIEGGAHSKIGKFAVIR